MNWNILLIAGSSGTGKTRTAKALAYQLGIECAQLDDFRLLAENISSPSQQPALHVLNDAQLADQLSPEMMCEKLIDVACVMSRAIEPVIAHHIATQQPLIIEGDGLLPDLGIQQHYFNLYVLPKQVRLVLLHETDEQTILRNILGRKRGIDHRPQEMQRKQARAAWLFGEWLRQKAMHHNLPIIKPTPWQTLIDRVLQSLES